MPLQYLARLVNGGIRLRAIGQCLQFCMVRCQVQKGLALGEVETEKRLPQGVERLLQRVDLLGQGVDIVLQRRTFAVDHSKRLRLDQGQ